MAPTGFRDLPMEALEQMARRTGPLDNVALLRRLCTVAPRAQGHTPPPDQTAEPATPRVRGALLRVPAAAAKQAPLLGQNLNNGTKSMPPTDERCWPSGRRFLGEQDRLSSAADAHHRLLLRLGGHRRRGMHPDPAGAAHRWSVCAASHHLVARA
jgi:hypothetical protein